MVFNIGLFLEKFKIITPPDDFIKKTVIEVIKNKTNIDIVRDTIKIEGAIVYMTVSSVVKNELYMRKKDLLEEINKKIPLQLIDMR